MECQCDASMFTISGIRLSSATSISCSATSYSCGMDVLLPNSIISSLGTLAFSMPSPGNCMGVTYAVTMTPLLNSSAIQSIQQTVWAGSDSVFGGPTPLVLSLATTWSRLVDDPRGISRKGWILSPAGTSIGSTLNNETFLTSTDKTFRASILLNRGTTFLNISLGYSSHPWILFRAHVSRQGSDANCGGAPSEE